MVQNWNLEQIDFATAADDVLRARYELAAGVRREALPDDDEPPFAEMSEAWKAVHEKRPHTNFGVWSDDGATLLGLAEVGWEEYDDNREMCYIDVDVAPDARRKHIGAKLFSAALGVAEAAARPLLVLDTNGHIPAGQGFARALGAEPKLTGRYSVLRFADVDRAQLEEWVARAAERAGEYHLEAWRGPCPDDKVDAFVAEQAVMNTAPMEEMEWEDEVFTVDRLRDREQNWTARNADWTTVVAVHAPSGEMVAHSDVMLPNHWPTRAYQNDTGVNPAHREKGLGRWLKAQMLLNLFTERPQLASISTWNAGSNDAMLGINYAMGFRTLGEFPSFQVRAGVARPRVDALLA